MTLRYSRQIVCSCSGDQNVSRDRQVLHRQPGEDSRIDFQAGTVLHQQSGEGAAHSTGREQLEQCFLIDTDEEEPITPGADAGAHRDTRGGRPWGKMDSLSRVMRGLSETPASAYSEDRDT